MPQIPVDKTYFSFAGGLNSEVSPLAFPEGTSLDEQNMEMRVNGTRRRRRAIARESGHVTGSVSVAGAENANMAVNSYRWTNVGGNPDLVFIVTQIGGSLLFAQEAEDISPEYYASYIDLTDMNSSLDDTNVIERPVDFASGRGYLFVTGRYVDPFYVEYDPDTDNFTATRIQIYVRDFRGVEDGIDIRSQPAALSADHEYNLVNRGWTSGLIAAYYSGTGAYPAKNQVYYRGYRRATTTGYAELDGTNEFNAAKLEAEAFGDSSAPQGALVLNPFNTGEAKLASAGASADIESFSYSVTYGSLWLVTITITGHGFSPSDVITINNSTFTYNTTGGIIAGGTLDGTYTINTTPTADTFTIYFYAPAGFASWSDQYVSKGQVGGDVVYRGDAYITEERPSAVAYFAGRIWWAGTSHPQINDTVYFTQITYNTKQFGKCYQEADPTSDFISALTPADGGTIVVPNLGAVHRMIGMEDALLIFAANGVWAILPAQQGGFRADGYNVRKLTDVEVMGPLCVRKIDSTATFCSPRGIYVLTPDQNSGQLNATSISEKTIQSLWNAIPDNRKREVQVCYDDSKKRIYYLYADSTVSSNYTYNAAYVFDVRLGAFYKLTFPHSDTGSDWKVRGILATGLGDATDKAKKIKFLGTKYDGGIKLDVYDMEQTGFTDFDGTEQSAYIVSGYDNLGDFARHRQAPVVHVYMQRTETGFEEGLDGGLDAVGQSSCWMQGRWDWSDASTAGKWGTEQQVYRHVRYYQPTGSEDTFNSGYPVVVTRNKLRGRGRCLHLRFRAGTGKDCAILGWALEYKGEKQQ